MDNNDTTKELNRLLREIAVKQGQIEVCVEDIRRDVRQHMADTRSTKQVHDKEIAWLKKHIYIAQGAIALIGVLSTLYRLGVFA